MVHKEELILIKDFGEYKNCDQKIFKIYRESLFPGALSNWKKHIPYIIISVSLEVKVTC